MTSGVDAFSKEIGNCQNRAKELAVAAGKLRDRLARVQKTLLQKPNALAVVGGLISDLRDVKAFPDELRLPELIADLERLLQEERQRHARAFPDELRNACQQADLPLVKLPEGFGVGPFSLLMDSKKEIAQFEYARVRVGSPVAIAPQPIIDQARALQHWLFETRTTAKGFGGELHEAIRVCLVRANKSIRGELRAELPQVYREMSFIRQRSGKHHTAPDEYALAQFVVDLKTFVQSDDNVRSSHPFRLEPAVIENAKNPKKSIFVPTDLSCGYGEGTYYQAVVAREG